jgi:hypothetical protein
MKRIMTATTFSAAPLALVFAPTAHADAGINWAGESTRPSNSTLVSKGIGCVRGKRGEPKREWRPLCGGTST